MSSLKKACAPDVEAQPSPAWPGLVAGRRAYAARLQLWAVDQPQTESSVVEWSRVQFSRLRYGIVAYHRQYMGPQSRRHQNQTRAHNKDYRAHHCPVPQPQSVYDSSKEWDTTAIPMMVYGAYTIEPNTTPAIHQPAKTRPKSALDNPQLSLIWSLFSGGGVCGWGWCSQFKYDHINSKPALYQPQKEPQSPVYGWVSIGFYDWGGDQQSQRFAAVGPGLATLGLDFDKLFGCLGVGSSVGSGCDNSCL